MRVTGTGESSPVVPRRQDGSVGLRTLRRSPSHCLYYLSGVCVQEREKERQNSLHLVFFSAVKPHFFFETDKRKRGEISKKTKNNAFFYYTCSCSLNLC